MNKSRFVLPKPNTNNDIDTSFSLRQLHFDDEKNGILNIVKITPIKPIKPNRQNRPKKEAKPRTKSSTAKPRTKSSTAKPRTKSSRMS